ncbi:MAG: hypothetical protein OXU40_06985 [Nitrospira sp.]|nr:hypothetical protein [Nitrospira sp.]
MTRGRQRARLNHRLESAAGGRHIETHTASRGFQSLHLATLDSCVRRNDGQGDQGSSPGHQSLTGTPNWNDGRGDQGLSQGRQSLTGTPNWNDGWGDQGLSS